MKCGKCGYEEPFGIDKMIHGDSDRGKNYCPECGVRLRKIPHVALPPDWDEFTIEIIGLAGRQEMKGQATSPGWHPINASGPSYKLEDLLRDKWAEEASKAVARNEEIDRINSEQ